MKGKVWVVLLGVLLIAALVAPTAFASWQSAQLSARSDQDMMNQDYQDMMVRPADIQASDSTDEDKQAPQSSNPSKGTGEDYYPPFDEESFNEFHDQMFNWGENWAEQEQKNGRITQEQSQAWQDHFAYMNNFHDQMGYNGMMGMMGGMMGGYGYGGNGGYGMMGGYGNGNGMNGTSY